MTSPQKVGAERVSDWLERNPTVSRNAMAALEVPGSGFTNAMLERPELLVNLIQRVTDQARAEKAPPDVVEELEFALAAMRAGLPNLPRYEYARRTLVNLREKTNPAAIQAALEKAAKQAPDDANRQKLEDIILALDVRAARGKSSGGSTTQRMSECPMCCLMGGIACLPAGPEGVAVCCMVGCLICGLM